MEKKLSGLKITEKIELREFCFRKVENKAPRSPPIIKPSNKNSQILPKVTSNLAKFYKRCNPEFEYTSNLNPRRVLTKPSEPVGTDCDNCNTDYILYVNDIIGSYTKHQYQVLDLLGQGTFGQVVKAINIDTRELVAIKVVKNKPAYFNQGLIEIQILEMLNHQYDADNQHHFVRLLDYFVYKNHLCLVFELLSINLYELIKQNQFRGLSFNLIRVFLIQILDALCVMSRANVIHCDLKPENILLESLTSPAIKVIDFGSACFEKQTVYSYIQSRFYRSPEVLIGLKYDAAIDMWSLGCICAELFLGLPLFPGSSEFNQLVRIIEMIGTIPNYLLSQGNKSLKYYTVTNGSFMLKTEEQYAKETNTAVQPSKKYFKYKTLPEIIENYAFKENLSVDDQKRERENRKAFVDFLLGILKLDPEERWTAEQAKMHPFVTGEPFTAPFQPQRIPKLNSTPPRIIPWGIQHPMQMSRSPHISMSFPDIPIGMESYASPNDYYHTPPHHVPQVPPLHLEHLTTIPSPRGPYPGQMMGPAISPRHPYQQPMYMNNMPSYPQNGINLRRQRSKSDINNKQKYHSPRGNGGNNEPMNGTPEKKSPRWPQDGRKDNSERRRARSFGGKMSNQSSVTPRSNLEDRSKRRSSPLSNLVANPEMDRAVSDKDSHGSHESNSPSDSPSGDGPEWEDQLLFDIETEQQQQQWNGQNPQHLYAQQQAEMYANFQNMHLGHSQQMQMYPNNPHMMPPNGNGHGQMGWGVNGMGIPNGYVPYIMGTSPNEHYMYSQQQMQYRQPPMQSQQMPTQSEKQRYQSKG